MSSSVYVRKETLGQDNQTKGMMAARETNLVVPCAEDELGFWVQIQDALDNFALIDRNWADFEIFFAHEYYQMSDKT
jgi:hypothetical protein